MHRQKKHIGASHPTRTVTMQRTLHRELPGYRALLQISGTVSEFDDAHKTFAFVDQLYGFLSVKRTTSFFGRGVYLSPGSRIDALWHAMLLETPVRDAVHREIGLDIPHSASNEANKSDIDKAVGRLAAMSLMACEGWDVQPEFWVEPGTLLDMIRFVPPLELNPGVYVSPHLDAAAVRRLVDTILLASGRTPGAENGHSCVQQLPTSVVATGPVGTGQSSKQRPRGNRRSGHGTSFAIFVRDMMGRNTPVEVHDNMMIKDVKRVLEDLAGLPVDQQRLIWTGKQLQDDMTVKACGLRNEATVHLVLRLSGC